MRCTKDTAGGKVAAMGEETGVLSKLHPEVQAQIARDGRCPA